MLVIIIVRSSDAFFTFLVLELNFVSIKELYNCPPSRGPIGSALNIPTLKLMNHIQKSKLENIGKLGPRMLESYFGAIKSE